MNPPHQDHPDPTLKLAVVLPALNEESTVGQVIAAVPRRLPGIGQVEVILVDDGSTDATVLRALAAGADRIARHARNRGLVAAFSRGITEALHAGADIVVHLDSDGQHDPARIPQLIAPIVAGEADIVVGVRPLAHASDMTLGKRLGIAGSAMHYISRAGGQALRCLLHTRPLAAFGRAAALMMLVALSFTGWFLSGYQSGGLHLPALLAALLAFVMSIGLFVSGLVADGIGSNRRLLEDLLYRMKALEARSVIGAADTAEDDLQTTRARLSEIA